MDFAVFGISAVVLVKLLVELLKKGGLSTRWAWAASILVGIVLAVANQLASMFPEFLTWYRAVFGGLIAGLGAAELYDAKKALERVAWPTK
ncbi:MAG TPA: hypothetical protein PK406_00540 [Verrucomicrobiota bacterium]|nr:hypothetical protein [Verrucomicrobiota bacterium]